MESKCPICLEDFVEKIRASPDACDHIFCLPCLERWSKLGSYCPVDRKRYKKILNLDSDHVIQVKPQKRRKIKRTLYDFSATCEVCSKDDNPDVLLLCDCCDLGFHLHCLSPPLKAVPAGLWFCPTCVSVENRLKEEKGITKEVEANFNFEKEISAKNYNRETEKKKIENKQFVSKNNSILEACRNIINEFEDITVNRDCSKGVSSSSVLDDSFSKIGKTFNFEAKSSSFKDSKYLKTYDLKYRKKKLCTEQQIQEVFNNKIKVSNVGNLCLKDNTLKDVSLLESDFSQSFCYGFMKPDILSQNNSLCKTQTQELVNEKYTHKNELCPATDCLTLEHCNDTENGAKGKLSESTIQNKTSSDEKNEDSSMCEDNVQKRYPTADERSSEEAVQKSSKLVVIKNTKDLLPSSKSISGESSKEKCLKKVGHWMLEEYQPTVLLYKMNDLNSGTCRKDSYILDERMLKTVHKVSKPSDKYFAEFGESSNMEYYNDDISNSSDDLPFSVCEKESNSDHDKVAFYNEVNNINGECNSTLYDGYNTSETTDEEEENSLHHKYNASTDEEEENYHHDKCNSSAATDEEGKNSLYHKYNASTDEEEENNHHDKCNSSAATDEEEENSLHHKYNASTDEEEENNHHDKCNSSAATDEEEENSLHHKCNASEATDEKKGNTFSDFDILKGNGYKPKISKCVYQQVDSIDIFKSNTHCECQTFRNCSTSEETSGIDPHNKSEYSDEFEKSSYYNENVPFTHSDLKYLTILNGVFVLSKPGSENDKSLISLQSSENFYCSNEVKVGNQISLKNLERHGDESAFCVSQNYRSSDKCNVNKTNNDLKCSTVFNEQMSFLEKSISNESATSQNSGSSSEGNECKAFNKNDLKHITILEDGTFFLQKPTFVRDESVTNSLQNSDQHSESKTFNENDFKQINERTFSQEEPTSDNESVTDSFQNFESLGYCESKALNRDDLKYLTISSDGTFILNKPTSEEGTFSKPLQNCDNSDCYDENETCARNDLNNLIVKKETVFLQNSTSENDLSSIPFEQTESDFCSKEKEFYKSDLKYLTIGADGSFILNLPH